MTHRDIIAASALAVALTFSSLSGAGAGEKLLAHDGANSKNLLIRPYLAPTGAVVPNPGQPQIGPLTAQEKKGAEEEANKIVNSICSNC
jgi:hypothetical protein